MVKVSVLDHIYLTIKSTLQSMGKRIKLTQMSIPNYIFALLDSHYADGSYEISIVIMVTRRQKVT